MHEFASLKCIKLFIYSKLTKVWIYVWLKDGYIIYNIKKSPILATQWVPKATIIMGLWMLQANNPWLNFAMTTFFSL